MRRVPREIHRPGSLRKSHLPDQVLEVRSKGLVGNIGCERDLSGAESGNAISQLINIVEEQRVGRSVNDKRGVRRIQSKLNELKRAVVCS